MSAKTARAALSRRRGLADDLEAYLADEPTAARSGLWPVVARAFRETHHAPVLENWGLLWMWHSLVLLSRLPADQSDHWQGETRAWPYVALWIVGLGLGGDLLGPAPPRRPITFVERQIAHVWAGSVVSIAGCSWSKSRWACRSSSLSPVLGLVSGMVFLVKAGILSGQFYVQAVALWLTAIAMALMQRYDIPGEITLLASSRPPASSFPA